MSRATARRAANFLTSARGSSSSGGAREEQLVPTVALDWLLDHARPPRFVKIDVEGAEEPVLQGAIRLLRDVRPGLLCEVTGRNRDAVTKLLRTHDYLLYDAEQPASERRPLEQAAWNTLCLPEERTRGGR